MLKVNTLWEKIKSQHELNYSDLEQYLYTKDYLSIKSSPEYFNYNKDEYNDSFYIYVFQTKKYDDYDDLFFQNFLDGHISCSEYNSYEEKAIEMCIGLFSKSPTYALYSCNSDSFYNNSPAKKSMNVLTCIEKLECNCEKIIYVDNEEFYKNLCYVALREIGSVHFIYPKLKMIILFSGFHGYITSEGLLDKDLLAELSQYCYIKIADWHNRKENTVNTGDGSLC